MCFSEDVQKINTTWVGELARLGNILLRAFLFLPGLCSFQATLPPEDQMLYLWSVP